MYYKEITDKEIESLRALNLGPDIVNCESSLFLIQIDNKTQLLKKFNINILYSELDNKLLTIGSLMDTASAFDERFILPQKIATIDDDVIGYLMNYIDNYNLGDLLKDPSIATSRKKGWLKEVGNILQFTEKLRNKYPELSKFYIGDLHVNNFMYNKKTKCLNVGDLDSCRIGKNIPSASLYMSTNSKVFFASDKYPINRFGINIPNRNSDIYCYIIMILNFLYGGHVQKMNLKEYYDYLQYMKENGMSNELLDIFAKIYQPGDNINPVELIDNIPDDISKFNRQKYLLKS